MKEKDLITFLEARAESQISVVNVIGSLHDLGFKLKIQGLEDKYGEEGVIKIAMKLDKMNKIEYNKLVTKALKNVHISKDKVEMRQPE